METTPKWDMSFTFFGTALQGKQNKKYEVILQNTHARTRAKIAPSEAF